MKLISPKRHKRLLAAAEKTESKYADEMLSKQIPVSVRIAQEIGFAIPKKAKDKLTEIDAASPKKGESFDVAMNVPLSEYLKKLRAYKPEEPKLAPAE